MITVGDLLLNSINLKGLSKNHSVKVNNIPGGASDSILDELDDFLNSPRRHEQYYKGEKSTE